MRPSQAAFADAAAERGLLTQLLLTTVVADLPPLAVPFLSPDLQQPSSHPAGVAGPSASTAQAPAPGGRVRFLSVPGRPGPVTGVLGAAINSAVAALGGPAAAQRDPAAQAALIAAAAPWAVGGATVVAVAGARVAAALVDPARLRDVTGLLRVSAPAFVPAALK